jgi:DNA-binding transcriptional regulator YhcF (GntR family)
MRFWFVHSGEVPIREQIVTQVTLGILSEELAPGERLPSTRELARRFNFHPNTVSAAYRQLEIEGWVKSKRGSGVFVHRVRRSAEAPNGYSVGRAYDHLFSSFLRSAQKIGIPPSDLKDRLRRWVEAARATSFLLIEQSEPLTAILLTEIREAIAVPILSCSPDEPSLSEKIAGTTVLALPSKAETVRAFLPAGSELITLQVRSASASLAQWLPAPSDALIGIASAWPQFLEIARTMLIAAGFSADALVLYDAAKPDWTKGLEATAAVVCDSWTAAHVPKGVRVIVYPLLTQASLEDLRQRSDAMGFPGA